MFGASQKNSWHQELLHSRTAGAERVKQIYTLFCSVQAQNLYCVYNICGRDFSASPVLCVQTGTLVAQMYASVHLRFCLASKSEGQVSALRFQWV